MALFSFLALIVIATWYFEPIPEATEHIVLDVNAVGKASVAYYKDSVIYYAQRIAAGDSFQWLTEIVDSGATGIGAGKGNPVELAIDKKPSPHLIYFKHGLYYTTKDSLGSWQSIALDTWDYYKSGLDTDTLDYPHVVCGGELRHYYWDGSSWNNEYIGGMGYVSLIIDRNNNLHIGIGPPLIGDKQRYFHYGFRDSTGWHVEYISGFDVRWPVGIAVDTTCCPHLAFYDFDSSYHSVKQNGLWTHENITRLGYFGKEIVIENIIPHVLGNQTTDTYVRHMWKPDSEWLFEDIYSSGYPKDFAIDNHGYLHCIIVDSLEIIYGTTKPQVIYEQTNSILKFSQLVTISRLPLSISLFGLESVGEIKIFDITGRLVKRLALSGNTLDLTWNGLDQHNKKVRTGIYFLMFDQKEKLDIKKLILID